jgi:hypothetical protein
VLYFLFYYDLIPCAGNHCFSDKSCWCVCDGAGLLSIFYATYLLPWGKPGSLCIPPIPKPTQDGSMKLINPSWGQVVIGSLPFIVLLITLFISSLVQAAERDGHTGGFVATLRLTEFIVVILLGGGMLVYMTGWLWMWLVHNCSCYLQYFCSAFSYWHKSFINIFYVHNSGWGNSFCRGAFVKTRLYPIWVVFLWIQIGSEVNQDNDLSCSSCLCFHSIIVLGKVVHIYIAYVYVRACTLLLVCKLVLLNIDPNNWCA